jgi:hypothetical protein
MCDMCRQSPCHSQCPNCEYSSIGSCDMCNEDLYEGNEIWTDCDGNKFCSEKCAKDYYKIREIDC